MLSIDTATATGSDHDSAAFSIDHSPTTLELTLHSCVAFARLVRDGASIHAHPSTIDELRSHHPLLWRLSGGSWDRKQHAIQYDATLPYGVIVARSNLRRGKFTNNTNGTNDSTSEGAQQ